MNRSLYVCKNVVWRVLEFFARLTEYNQAISDCFEMNEINWNTTYYYSIHTLKQLI